VLKGNLPQLPVSFESVESGKPAGNSTPLFTVGKECSEDNLWRGGAA